MFSVLEGTNAMSGKRSVLQKRIRLHSPFSMYNNCWNHHLASCLLHLMKELLKELNGELLSDYDALLLGLWKCFTIHQKRRILESIQLIYCKKRLKIIKAAIAGWLTHGKLSHCV